MQSPSPCYVSTLPYLPIVTTTYIQTWKQEDLTEKIKNPSPNAEFVRHCHRSHTVIPLRLHLGDAGCRAQREGWRHVGVEVCSEITSWRKLRRHARNVVCGWRQCLGIEPVDTVQTSSFWEQTNARQLPWERGCGELTWRRKYASGVSEGLGYF